MGYTNSPLVVYTFTVENLNALLHEAEEIMEGWTDTDGGEQNECSDE